MLPLFFLLALGASAQTPVQQPAVTNRAPLAPNALTPLPLTAVKPRGWLKRQLEIQAAGQTGHLDEFWPSLTADSGWLGGTGESWERGPYYLDGLLPLAFLLDSPELKAKALKWVNWTLDHQRPDGAIGPERNTDWWPTFVQLKVLAQYHEATGDPRVLAVMRRYFEYMNRKIEADPLKQWAIYRWGDQELTIAWLYNRTGDAFLLDLARKLSRQGYNWKGHFADFKYPGKVSRGETGLHTHVVNNAMAIKTSGVWSWFSGEASDKQALHRLLEVMDKHHLHPNGVHGGDEHYAGLSPVQGTELCAVVEAMFSLELMMALHGDAALGDRLEKIAFNALPGTFDAAMWAHQYDQQPNQTLVSVHRRDWTTNGPDSNLYGLEPNFGCCTANFHQGWPKFASHLWMATPGGGLAAVAWAPNQVRSVAGGVKVEIDVATEYPFRDRIDLTVKPEKAARFPLLLRIPAWAARASVEVNGKAEPQVKAGAFHRVLRQWKDGDKVTLRLPMDVRASRWYNNAVALDRGPLVFSLAIGQDWRKLRDRGPTADWAVHPTTPWNYALALDPANPAASVQAAEQPIPDAPFAPSAPPVVLKAKARRVPGWGMRNASAAPPPASPADTQEPVETVDLIPYGAAKLRITLFPLARQ
jgi:hypothetical protein